MVPRLSLILCQSEQAWTQNGSHEAGLASACTAQNENVPEAVWPNVLSTVKHVKVIVGSSYLPCVLWLLSVTHTRTHTHSGTHTHRYTSEMHSSHLLFYWECGNGSWNPTRNLKEFGQWNESSLFFALTLSTLSHTRRKNNGSKVMKGGDGFPLSLHFYSFQWIFKV